MESPEPRLTPRQAYYCMFEFLRRHYERGPTDEVGGLLGGLSLLPDGQPTDAAYVSDWAESVDAVLKAERDGGYGETMFRLG